MAVPVIPYWWCRAARLRAAPTCYDNNWWGEEGLRGLRENTLADKFRYSGVYRTAVYTRPKVDVRLVR